MRLLTFLLLLLLAAPARAETFLHDGIERTYTLRGDAGNAPAILVLHGGGGSGARAQRHAGFSLARQGWVEIYPDALGRAWNDGRTALRGGPLRHTDDVGFLTALLGRLTAKGRIDPARIYVTGPSNGGAMTQRLICQTDLIAGAAVLIMNRPVGLRCPRTRPVAMLFFLGTEDPLVPFAGGPITLGRKDRGAVRPARETLAFYARRNRCRERREILLEDRDPDDGTRVRRIAYTGCAAPLTAYIVHGGGHTWPGARSRRALRGLLGRTSRDISATAIIQRFFTSLANR